MTLNTITVQKDRLLEALVTNRDSHSAKVALSRAVYREMIIEELDKRLDDARKGADIDPGFLHLLPIPRDFTQEYDRAIDQYQWEINSTIEMTREDFNKFVRDEWPWREMFITSNSMYLSDKG